MRTRVGCLVALCVLTFLSTPCVFAIPLEIVTPSLPTGMEMVSYSATLEATNGIPPYSWSVSLVSDHVTAWGANGDGQSTVPEGLSNMVAIAGGVAHSLAVRSDGIVVAWGNNSYGQSMVPTGLSNAVAVAGGAYFSLALRSNGTVVAWGDNREGQSTVPGSLSNVIAITAGFYHSLALRSNGTVVAWGGSAVGQTNVPAGLSNAVAIAGGEYHSVALCANGTVVAWGYNNQGQCTVPAGLSNVVAVAAGAYHTLALRRNGTVTAWGDDNRGQCAVPEGVSNVMAVACDGCAYHNLALRSDGMVAAWGDNSHGQSTVPAGLSNVTVIAAGQSHSLALSGNRRHLPLGLACSTDGVLSGTPALVGTSVVTFVVHDDGGASTNRALEIVIAANPNTRPVIASNAPPTGAFSMNEGTSRMFTVWAYDPEGSNVNYCWTWDSSSVGSNSSSFTHTTEWGDAGIHQLRCHISDDLWSNVVFAEWVVTVVDMPIEITTPSLPAGMELVAYSATLEATNGVWPYAWDVSDLPAGLSCSTNGVISGTPTLAGTTTVTSLVEDNVGATTSKPLEIVIAANPNRRPIIYHVSPDTQTVAMPESTSKVFRVYAYDPEDVDLTYSWIWDGSVVGLNDSRFTNTTTWGDAGSHIMRCYVSDDLWSNIVYAEWSVDVLDDNDGDGMPNWQELDLGRDPNDPADAGLSSSLSGMVRGSGIGLADAYVELRGVSGRIYRSGLTDTGGLYTVGSIQPGNYLIKAGAERFADEWYDNAAHQTSAVPYSIPANSIIGGFNFDLISGQNPAFVEVTSDPTGATVYLDYQPTTNVTPVVLNMGEAASHAAWMGGDVASHTLWVASHAVWVGGGIASHVVTVKKAGRPRPPPQAVAAKEAETVSVHFDLSSDASGGTSVATAPDGASVYIDYADVSDGVTPVLVGGLAPGSHTILLRKSGLLQPRPVVTWVQDNYTNEVAIALETNTSPDRFVADVRSIPPAATIYLDYLLTTNVTDAVVDWMDPASHAGSSWHSASHTIMLRKNGYLPPAPRYVADLTNETQNILVHLIGDSASSLDDDHDGLPDEWEDAYRLRELAPGENGPGDDPDGDTMTNDEERRAGTNPLDPNSQFALDGPIVVLDPVQGETVTLVFDTVPGRLYILQHCNELDGAWGNLSSLVLATNYLTTFTTQVPEGTEHRYYRLLGLTP